MGKVGEAENWGAETLQTAKILGSHAGPPRRRDLPQRGKRRFFAADSIRGPLGDRETP
jgi:hypothetical protein